MFDERTIADIITRYKFEVCGSQIGSSKGVTQLGDSVGYGLINTLNILANTKEYRSNPLQISEVHATGDNTD